MIRALRLRDWRNYADVEIQFNAGVTFVVATNGVGKTSMIEAARWAMFGALGPTPEAAIRAGAISAEASVDVVLPSTRVLTITRPLVQPSNRKDTQPEPKVTIDGAAFPPGELAALLASEYKTDPAFLARLTMPAPGRNDDKPHTLGLENHLGQIFGINGLRTALARLDELKLDNDRAIRGIKQTNSASAKRLADLTQLVRDTQTAVEEQTTKLETAQSRAETVREYFRLQDARTSWNTANEARLARLEAVARRTTEKTGIETTAATVHDTIRTALASVDDALGTVRVDIAVAVAQTDSVIANLQRLDESHADCPVCRRPLDDETIDTAHAEADNELAHLRERTTELADLETDLTEQRGQLVDLQSELDNIPSLTAEPTHADSVTFVDYDRHAAAVDVTEVMDALVEARADATQAQRDLETAREADRAMRELERLFRREAKLRVATETTQATLDEVLETTVGPIASEVDQRWSGLFPNRGSLTTRADGTITRRVNDHDVPYDSFSTGEGMGATILLRLVVAHLTSVADFIWFDEPLEHLDPDVRRHVANMLSRVTAGDGPVRQVVVTTYEDPLARQLRARDSHRVHLVDVRPGHTVAP
jgi:DNA repair exonuclease SbcCD ATPase subunit